MTVTLAATPGSVLKSVDIELISEFEAITEGKHPGRSSFKTESKENVHVVLNFSSCDGVCLLCCTGQHRGVESSPTARW